MFCGLVFLFVSWVIYVLQFGLPLSIIGSLCSLVWSSSYPGSVFTSLRSLILVVAVRTCAKVRPHMRDAV